MSTVGSTQTVWGIQGSAHHQSEHWLLPRQTDHPVSLFSSTVLSTDSSKYRPHLSVHLLLQSFPASTCNTSQNDHATQQNRSASMSPPPPTLPSYFLWLPRGARTEKGMKMLSAFETRGSGGPPTTGSLCSNVGRETPGTFFLYPVTVISNQTQHLALSCLNCLCFIFSPLAGGCYSHIILYYKYKLLLQNQNFILFYFFFYKIRILVPQANMNQESEPLFIPNL